MECLCGHCDPEYWPNCQEPTCSKTDPESMIDFDDDSAAKPLPPSMEDVNPTPQDDVEFDSSLTLGIEFLCAAEVSLSGETRAAVFALIAAIALQVLADEEFGPYRAVQGPLQISTSYTFSKPVAFFKGVPVYAAAKAKDVTTMNFANFTNLLSPFIVPEEEPTIARDWMSYLFTDMSQEMADDIEDLFIGSASVEDMERIHEEAQAHAQCQCDEDDLTWGEYSKDCPRHRGEVHPKLNFFRHHPQCPDAEDCILHPQYTEAFAEQHPEARCLAPEPEETHVLGPDFVMSKQIEEYHARRAAQVAEDPEHRCPNCAIKLVSKITPHQYDRISDDGRSVKNWLIYKDSFVCEKCSYTFIPDATAPETGHLDHTGAFIEHTKKDEAKPYQWVCPECDHPEPQTPAHACPACGYCCCMSATYKMAVGTGTIPWNAPSFEVPKPDSGPLYIPAERGPCDECGSQPGYWHAVGCTKPVNFTPKVDDKPQDDGSTLLFDQCPVPRLKPGIGTAFFASSPYFKFDPVCVCGHTKDSHTPRGCWCCEHVPNVPYAPYQRQCPCEMYYPEPRGRALAPCTGDDDCGLCQIIRYFQPEPTAPPGRSSPDESEPPSPGMKPPDLKSTPRSKMTPTSILRTVIRDLHYWYLAVKTSYIMFEDRIVDAVWGWSKKGRA